jgi:hypothetical protein
MREQLPPEIVAERAAMVAAIATDPANALIFADYLEQKEQAPGDAALARRLRKEDYRVVTIYDILGLTTQEATAGANAAIVRVDTAVDTCRTMQNSISGPRSLQWVYEVCPLRKCLPREVEGDGGLTWRLPYHHLLKVGYVGAKVFLDGCGDAHHLVQHCPEQLLEITEALETVADAHEEQLRAYKEYVRDHLAASTSGNAAALIAAASLLKRSPGRKEE